MTVGDLVPVPRVRATLGAVYLGGSGLVASLVWGLLLVDLTGASGTAARQAVSSVGLGLGTATVAYFYVRWTDRDWSFLDFAVPDRRDLAYLGAGLVAVFVLFEALDVVYSALGVRTATHGTVEDLHRGDTTVLAVSVGASLLLVGPGEELLYRNVVQKSLYDAFPRAGAVLVASAVFAAIHVPAYLPGAPTAGALVATLLVVFALSLVLGTAYARTGNTVVPAVIHGVYNAVTFVVLVL